MMLSPPERVMQSWLTVLSSSEQMCWEVSFLVKHFIDIADMMKTVMSNEKVAFTGHRSIPFATINVLRQRISDCVENLYLSGKTEYLCGMALGFDLLCAEVVLSLKKQFSDIRLICVLPYRAQSEMWNSMQKARHGLILDQADEIIVLSEEYFHGCFLRRNDYMLKRCSTVVAYYDGKLQGGTYYTFKKARENRLRLINLYSS